MGIFAYNAPRRNHRSTELWALLNKGADLPANYPPELLLEVLRKTYVRYAELAAIVALCLSVAAGIVWLTSLIRSARWSGTSADGPSAGAAGCWRRFRPGGGGCRAGR